jgi:hypothetical protein
MNREQKWHRQQEMAEVKREGERGRELRLKKDRKL